MAIPLAHTVHALPQAAHDPANPGPPFGAKGLAESRVFAFDGSARFTETSGIGDHRTNVAPWNAHERAARVNPEAGTHG
ncbi:MAG TPA: hypothetical protein VFA86_03070 [Gammaproteobacteria bacterium]|nr:hypothetical protein [Gammaproteobacteria bacterium]